MPRMEMLDDVMLGGLFRCRSVTKKDDVKCCAGMVLNGISSFSFSFASPTIHQTKRTSTQHLQLNQYNIS